MAFTGLLALIDDITTVLDDIAVLVKLSAKKTSGLVTDDLVVTAEQVAAITTKKEVPIILEVAKGSLVNKAILIPAALAINFFVPFLIAPLLLLGAAYLCYEATEKIWHALSHRAARHKDAKTPEGRGEELTRQEELGEECLQKIEGDIDAHIKAQQTQKIQSAIRTDFILSAEIIIIALGVIAAAPMATQVMTLIAVGLLMTVVVYGAVILLVKVDDVGLYCVRRAASPDAFLHRLGRGCIVASVKMMTWLSVIGTAAMLLVGGEIAVHKIYWIEQVLHGALHYHPNLPFIGGVVAFAVPLFLNMLIGIVYGAVVIGIVSLGYGLKNKIWSLKS